MKFARKKAWHLHKHVYNRSCVQACENSSDHRTEQLKRELAHLGPIVIIKPNNFVDSSASLHMRRMNVLLWKKKPENQKNPPSSRLSTVRGRVDGRGDSVRQRFGRFVYDDAVERFTSSAFIWFIMRRKWATLTNGNELPSSVKDGTVIRCKSENHVPLVAVSQEPRIFDLATKASGDRLQIPGVRAL